MSTGAQYVVAAYGVVLFALLMYVVVVGLRSARLAREAELLALLVERRDGLEAVGVPATPPRETAETPPSAART